jgi:hypothetical protein
MRRFQRRRSVTPGDRPGILRTALVGVGLLALMLAAGAADAQTVLSETTWGGFGSDTAEGVATAADGSSYVVGLTDSFTVDQFGTPSPKIFLVKFTSSGAVAWQRIWNGTTVRGLGRTGVALGGGAVYVTGVSASNGNDAVLLKFDVDGGLQWERTWGGASSDAALGVAAAADGSAYVVGTAESFGTGSTGFFVVKFDASGTLVWQRIRDGAEGNAVAVGPDGSVYAAGTTPRPDLVGNFDLLALKITSAGSLVWQRTYSAGDVADPRGGVAAGSDGSMYIAGAVQATRRTSDISALVVKLGTDGSLLFDKEFGGRNGETAGGIAVAPDDGSVYVTGTTSSFGAGFQDAFVLHLQATGKKVLDAVTWGGAGFEEGTGVSVVAGAVSLAATTTNPPPYVLAPLAAKLSGGHGVVGVSAASLDPVPGVVSDPAAGAAVPAGSTTYGGNFESALVRIAR